MSPRKLTEEDKQDILKQYRNSEATTSTLAKSYQVSSSTISRFLKNKLSSEEYEDLIQQKRLARTPRGEKSAGTKTNTRKSKSKTKPATPTVSSELAEKQQETATPEETKQTITRRRRRRSITASESVAETEAPPTRLNLDRSSSSQNDAEDLFDSRSEGMTASRPILKSERVELEEEEEDDTVDIITLKEMLGEDLEDINDVEDEEDEDEEDWDEEESVSYSKSSSISNIEILPLSQASFPRTCYLVIDRSAELIVKPLADFADLGSIPDAEEKQRTLPVFDNHHIAKRFSHRRERVIKVPDGRMIQKTSHHLQDKGITRLLIDGQIYAL